MRRRTLAIASMLLIFLCTLFGDEFRDRTWAYNGEQASTINLARAYYLPRYDLEWDKDQGPEGGTYITYASRGEAANGIGNIGVAACPDRITFTVRTSGQFVSESDPTKYRDFFVALKPRARVLDTAQDKVTGSDVNYYLGSAIQSDRVPNTRGTFTVSVTTPALPSLLTDGKYKPSELTDETKIYTGPVNGWSHVSRIYFDVLLCLDPITSQDKVHLAELDDYMATIEIEWHCTNPECTNPGAHSGHFLFSIRGFYGSGSSNVGDNVFMFVNPEAVSSRLNIMEIINGDGREKIATMEVSTTSKKDMDWLKRVMVFISSSPDPTVPGEPFKLVRYYPVTETQPEIPYVIRVYNQGFENTSTYNKSYDGTAKWTDYSTSYSSCLNFSGNMKDESDNTVAILNSYRNRDDSIARGILFNGVVMLEITDQEAKDDIIANRSSYSGLYKSDIYYHIIYNK